MVGRAMTEVFPKRPIAPGAVALELRHLSNRALGIHDVSLSVRRGEVLGVAGLVGSGRTELAETLFGLAPADGGEILLRGEPVRIDVARRRPFALGIGYVPEDRRQHGVVLEMPIAANATLASLDAVSSQRPDRPRRRTAVGARATSSACASRRRRSRPRSARSPAAISRRWRWRAGSSTGPDVLILDEPTQGVDVGAKAEIHALIQELAERGLAILMISSELPEILGMSDRVAVMHAGTISGVLSRAEATQDAILALALEQPAPSPPRHATECRRTPRESRSRLPSRRWRSSSPSPRRAISPRGNLSDMFLANLPVLLVALGMTLVIVTGEIDISVGSMFAICGVVAGILAKAGMPVWLACAAGMPGGRGARIAERRAGRRTSASRRSSSRWRRWWRCATVCAGRPRRVGAGSAARHFNGSG